MQNSLDLYGTQQKLEIEYHRGFEDSYKLAATHIPNGPVRQWLAEIRQPERIGKIIVNSKLSGSDRTS